MSDEKTKVKRASPAQRAALRNLAAGRRANHGLPGGRSYAGGFDCTMRSIHRNGWVDRDGKITSTGYLAAGLAVVAPEEKPNVG